jgi:hypothetical protein
MFQQFKIMTDLFRISYFLALPVRSCQTKTQGGQPSRSPFAWGWFRLPHVFERGEQNRPILYPNLRFANLNLFLT